jgi:large subunit ribosomal protein L25
MTDAITISLQKREVTGKAVKRLRQAGQVPAVIHDHGRASIVVTGEYTDMARVYRRAGRHHPVTVEANGKQYTTLIKWVDRDPRKNTLTHVVFNAINANQKVEAEIPVRVKYDEGNDASPAERNGLIVLHQLEVVEVLALPKNLPDYLEFDGEKLTQVGDTATVADLIVPKGVEIKAEADHQLASVFEPSALAAANDAAGGDADAGDEENVAADHESGTTEGTQKDEIRPGGKKEFEDKGQAQSPEKK